MNEQSPGAVSTADIPITPQPKQILNLRNTLAARPKPQPAVTSPTGPASAPEAAPSQTQVATGSPQLTARTEPSSTPSQRATGASAARPAADQQPRPQRRRDHTVFYLPIEVSDRLRDVARRQNKTNADVIFDAIEAAIPELPNLLAPATSQRGGGVFDRRATKPVGQKVQISAVISGRNLAVIDQLVADHGADSRSQLVEASLNVYLAAPDAVTA